MKNVKRKSKLTGVIAVLLILLAFSPATSKAQCPNIQNNLSCSIEVVESTSYATNCTRVCGPFIHIVGPGATMPFNCSCASTICGASIQVTAINGVAVTSAAANFGTVAPGNNITGPSGTPCIPVAGPSPRIYYDAGPNVFRIVP